MIRTNRLILRQWEDQDIEPFAALNADPRVMEYFPSVLSLEESAQLLHTSRLYIEKRGWGKWAVVLIETGKLIGRIGLEEMDFSDSFPFSIELGYRIAFEHWGKGYATEGVQAALAFGFDTLCLKEIVAFTVVQNMRSRRIMEKIGMHYDVKDDFDHPKLPEGHPLRRHVFYRINQQKHLNAI